MHASAGKAATEKEREGERTKTEEDNTKEGPSHNKENLPLDALDKDAAATKCWCMQQCNRLSECKMQLEK